MIKAVLFDWGDTLMKVFDDELGPMHTWSKIEAMPNAVEALMNLSAKVKCCLATNAMDSNHEDIKIALSKIGLDKYISDVFCYGNVNAFKPSATYFNKILQELDLKSEEVLMVGDDLNVDVLGAIDVGMKGVLYDPYGVYAKYEGHRIWDLMEVEKYL